MTAARLIIATLQDRIGRSRNLGENFAADAMQDVVEVATAATEKEEVVPMVSCKYGKTCGLREQA